jgi:signal transduction histidine kinase
VNFPNTGIKLTKWLEPAKEDIVLVKIAECIDSKKSCNTVIQHKKSWYNLSINPKIDSQNNCSSAIIIAYDYSDTMKKQMELNNLADELELSRDAFQDNASELAKAYDELEYSRQELERFSRKLGEQNKLLSESDEKQKILNAQKDKFVSIISHDLRAPFTSILGYSEALITAWNSITETEKLDFIGIINKAAKTQLELLDTLLQWSRLETNRVQVKPEVICALSLVENCVMSLSGIAQKKNILIEIIIPENISILGDHLLLSQVIQNLLSNALKFTRNGGKITIAYDGTDENNTYKFFIRDTGIGMPESIRTKLFRIDSKVSRKGTSGEAGTGLGLLVCKEIIDLHYGSIHVESVDNEGTSFFFSLPKAFPNVLLIKNELSENEYFNKLIKEYFPDFNIISVQNTTQAEKYFTNPELSLLLYDNDNDSDLNDKKLFFDWINRDSIICNIPCILITSDIDQDTFESYLTNGIDFIITKPFDENLVIDTLTKILFGLLNQS